MFPFHVLNYEIEKPLHLMNDKKSFKNCPYLLFIPGINNIWLISDILYPVTSKMNAACKPVTCKVVRL